MTKISVKEAKERLPELLDEGAKGEEIVIDGDGATVTVVVLETAKRTRHADEVQNPPFAALRGAGGGQVVPHGRRGRYLHS